MKETICYLPQRNWEHTNYAWETDTDVRVELSSYSTPSTAASTSSSPGTRFIKEGGIVPHQKEGELLEEITHFFLLLLTRRCFDAEKRKPKVAPGSCCSGFTQGDTKVGLTW